MADTSPNSRRRRGQQLEVLPSQTGPEPWIRAVMTVPLAVLGFGVSTRNWRPESR